MTLNDIKSVKYNTELKSMVVYPSYANAASRLGDAEYGKFCRVLFHYGFTGERVETDNIAIEMALDIVAPLIDANEEKYAKTCFKNKHNAKQSSNSENNGRPSMLDNEEFVKDFKNNYNNGMGKAELATKYKLCEKTVVRYIVRLGLDKTRQNPTKPLNDNDTDNSTETNNDTITDTENKNNTISEDGNKSEHVEEAGKDYKQEYKSLDEFEANLGELSKYFKERYLNKFKEYLMYEDYRKAREVLEWIYDDYSHEYDKEFIKEKLECYLPTSSVEVYDDDDDLPF